MRKKEEFSARDLMELEQEYEKWKLENDFRATTFTSVLMFVQEMAEESEDVVHIQIPPFIQFGKSQNPYRKNDEGEE